MGSIGCLETSVRTTTHCMITQKSADLEYRVLVKNVLIIKVFL
jgi:hypothetical protein